MEKYHDIYDRIAKRCISLSDRTTINLPLHPPEESATSLKRLLL